MWFTRLSEKGIILKDYIVKNRRLKSIVAVYNGSTYYYGSGDDENSRAVAMYYGLVAAENQKENQLKLF